MSAPPATARPRPPPVAPAVAADPGRRPADLGRRRSSASSRSSCVWWIASRTLFTASGAIPHPGDGAGQALLRDRPGPTRWATSPGTARGRRRGLPHRATSSPSLLAALVLLRARGWSRSSPRWRSSPTACRSSPSARSWSSSPAATRRRAPRSSLAALSVFFTTVVGALLGLRAAPRTSLDVIAAYGGTRLDRSCARCSSSPPCPNLFAALKIAAPAAFLGAVLAEYLGSGGDAQPRSGADRRAEQLRRARSCGSSPWCPAAVAGLAYALIGLVGRFVTPWSAGLGREAGRDRR